MEGPLEAVQFLANSANRVDVLTALLDGEATQQDLQDDAGCSRSTVGRILNEAAERGWVASEGSRYWLTPLGEAMVAEFRSYVETVEGLYTVADLVRHFPPPLLSPDFRHFRDAEIVESTTENPAAPFTRALELFHDADTHRGVSFTAVPWLSGLLVERAKEGQLAFEHVFGRAHIQTIREEADRTEFWNGMADRVWVYDGVVPICFHVVDETVVVWLGETRREVEGILVSENPELVSWAESFFEEYRSEAEPLDPAMLSQE